MSKKILVVDDDPVQRQHISNLLSGIDAELILAVNGQQGVAKALEELPDLILMDVVMPEVDGFAACRQITSAAETQNIPVIIVSSKNQEADRVWAQLQGAKAMISKPFADQELLARVNDFL